MKKVLYTALALLLVSAVFVNCQKDGIFNPKQKISKVSQPLDGITLRLEEWTWEGDLLSRISYFHRDTIVKNKVYYFYEKKQLVRMEYADFSYCTIKYDGSQYSEINFFTQFERNTSTLKFTYEKKKVSQIVETRYANPQKSMGDAENKLMSAFFPKIVLEAMDKHMSKTALQKANEDVVLTHKLTYDDKGDNLKEWRISQTLISKVGESMLTKLRETVLTYDSYDDKVNPYYASSPAGEGYAAFYKNNPTKVTFNMYEDNLPIAGSTDIFNYTYQYDDKKYPTEVIGRHLEGAAADTTYYEYKTGK